jgi:hypothetical protein
VLVLGSIQGGLRAESIAIASLCRASKDIAARIRDKVLLIKLSQVQLTRSTVMGSALPVIRVLVTSKSHWQPARAAARFCCG